MSTVGDILSTVGDIMSTVGVILSTMGDTQYCGDIMSTIGGKIFCYLSTPRYSNFKGWYPPRY